MTAPSLDHLLADRYEDRVWHRLSILVYRAFLAIGLPRPQTCELLWTAVRTVPGSGIAGGSQHGTAVLPLSLLRCLIPAVIADFDSNGAFTRGSWESLRDQFCARCRAATRCRN